LWPGLIARLNFGHWPRWYSPLCSALAIISSPAFRQRMPYHISDRVELHCLPKIVALFLLRSALATRVFLHFRLAAEIAVVGEPWAP